MAEGLNKAILLGNVGNEPELRYTQSGQAVMNLRLATTERRKGSDGQYQDATEWHSVVVWGKRAEGLSKVLQKGSQLLVEGSLRTSEYERDGAQRQRTEINAYRVLLVGSRPNGQRSQPAPAPPQATAQAPQGGQSGGGWW